MLTKTDRAVLDALLPSGAHPELRLSLREAGFEDFYADFDKTANWRMRLGFKAALLAAAWIAPLLIARLPPITLYGAATRALALEALGKSRFYVLRQLMLILKATVSFCYGANPDVRRALRFPQA